MQGKTVTAIAHRMAMIARMDPLVVLEAETPAARPAIG
jgi:hypothetical protein